MKLKTMGKFGYNSFKHTYEMCPHCEQEVKLKNKFAIQECPECKSPILPCSICDATNESVPEPKCSCDNCPLETQEFRDLLIARTFNALFKDDSLDNRDSNLAYLNALTNMELSIKLNEHLSYEINGFFDLDDEDDE